MNNDKLKERCGNLCELCSLTSPNHEYIVIAEKGYDMNNIVALCDYCYKSIESKDKNVTSHWQCLAASIWSEQTPVQVLSYRMLHLYKDQEWANDIINSVELSDSVIDDAIRMFEIKEVHKDCNGIVLENGDNVVLTQVLNVKGANFMAPKGTIVKKIKLVPDNTNQIEGKVNDQTIIILTQFVKKG